MERTIVHMILHFLVPFMVAKTAWKENWLFPFIIMALTITVDFDHLLVDPIFDTNRCGLGFHPLHSWPAMAVYIIAIFSPSLRIVTLGLLIHMELFVGTLTNSVISSVNYSSQNRCCTCVILLKEFTQRCIFV